MLSNMEAQKDAADAEAMRVILWLKEERLKRGISSAKLAKKIGIARATISHMEAGTHWPAVNVLFRVSRGLGLSPGDWPG